jgi:hypothetical protein
MKLFNRGHRTFNPGTPHALIPGRWTELPDEDAKKLLKSYPRDLTTNDQPTGPSAEEIRLAKENADLKTKLAAYEARMDGLEKIATAPTPPLDAPIPAAPAPAKATKPALKTKTVTVL